MTDQDVEKELKRLDPKEAVELLDTLSKAIGDMANTLKDSVRETQEFAAAIKKKYGLEKDGGK